MIKKWGIYLGLIAMLVFMSLWLNGIKTTNQLRKENAGNTASLEKLTQLLEQKNTIIFNNFVLSGVDLSSFSLRDLSGNQMDFSELFENEEPIVIAYFDSGMCSVCLEREWMNFLALVGRTDKILLFANGYPSAYFRQKKEFSSLQKRIFIVQNGSPMSMESPIYFVRHAQGFHAFQVEKNTDATYEIVEQVLTFLKM